MVGILYLANIDSFQSSKNYIYQNQQKEALQKLSQVVTVILSNEVACKQFMIAGGLMNSNSNVPNTQELKPRFYNSAGAAGDTIADKIFTQNELAQKPVFKLVNVQPHSPKTVLAYLQPSYSNSKSFKFNTEALRIPIFLEVNPAQLMVGCRTTVKSTFDNSATIDDYLCKAFKGTNNVLYSFGLRTCVVI